MAQFGQYPSQFSQSQGQTFNQQPNQQLVPTTSQQGVVSATGTNIAPKAPLSTGSGATNLPATAAAVEKTAEKPGIFARWFGRGGDRIGL